MIGKQTYFVGGLEESLRKRLTELKEFCSRSGYISCITLLDSSMEILESLNTKSIPAGDIPELRKALILEFYKKHSVDIDLNLSLSQELVSKEYIGVRVEQLVSEYYIRLWNCLKIILKSLSSILNMVTPSVPSRKLLS